VSIHTDQNLNSLFHRKFGRGDNLWTFVCNRSLKPLDNFPLARFNEALLLPASQLLEEKSPTLYQIRSKQYRNRGTYEPTDAESE
jgi:hypothetical protein